MYECDNINEINPIHILDHVSILHNYSYNDDMVETCSDNQHKVKPYFCRTFVAMNNENSSSSSIRHIQLNGDVLVGNMNKS